MSPQGEIYVNREQVPDAISALVQSEWDVIKRFQRYVHTEWGTISSGSPRLPDSCCGIYFYANIAMATNDHWSIMIDTKRSEWPEGVHSLFYNYISDDVTINYDPYAEAGYDIRDIQRPFFQWQPYIVKVRVVDLTTTIDGRYPNVKDKRKVAARFTVDADSHQLNLQLEHRDGDITDTTVPLWRNVERGSHQTGFTVNSAYIYKVVEIAGVHGYHVVDICYTNNQDEPILIKAYNPRAPHKIPKPRIVVAVGQYYFS